MTYNEFGRIVSVDFAPRGSRCEWCEKPAEQHLSVIGGKHHNVSGLFCFSCGEDFVCSLENPSTNVIGKESFSTMLRLKSQFMKQNSLMDLPEASECCSNEGNLTVTCVLCNQSICSTHQKKMQKFYVRGTAPMCYKCADDYTNYLEFVSPLYAQ